MAKIGGFLGFFEKICAEYIENFKKNKYFMNMFQAGDIVKVLISNIPNAGYDYRLKSPADIGAFVSVNVMNRPCVGVVWGMGDSNLPESKIKDVSVVHDAHLSVTVNCNSAACRVISIYIKEEFYEFIIFRLKYEKFWMGSF